MDVLTSGADLGLVQRIYPARRNSLSYVGGRESCVSWVNPNVGMRLTFQLSLRQRIASARQSCSACQANALGNLSGFLPAYAKRGALRFLQRRRQDIRDGEM